jgi:hypothetical protein
VPREIYSENVQVMTGNDLAPEELANLFQHLSLCQHRGSLTCPPGHSLHCRDGYSTKRWGFAPFAISASCLVEV